SSGPQRLGGILGLRSRCRGRSPERRPFGRCGVVAERAENGGLDLSQRETTPLPGALGVSSMRLRQISLGLCAAIGLLSPNARAQNFRLHGEAGVAHAVTPFQDREFGWGPSGN